MVINWFACLQNHITVFNGWFLFLDYSIDELAKQKEKLEEEKMENSKKTETDDEDDLDDEQDEQDEDGDDDIIGDREASGYQKFNQNW